MAAYKTNHQLNMKTKEKNNTKPLGTKQQHTPMLPSGIDNFHDLITHRNEQGNGYLFVDKSLFIRAFLNAGDKITLITRPRRFGKTLTLSMLEHFLAPEVNGQSTKGLFEGLQISKHPKIMEKQGQSPVIFLTLKEAKGKTYEKILGVIKNKIRELYQTHLYLLSSDRLFPSQKKDFQEILDKATKDDDYQSSLHALSRYLYQHTGKKVYILLDEYDTPINDAYVHGCYEDCRNFLAGMFGETFKGNNFLEKGLITGILKIAKASLFSDLSNLKVYTTLSKKYANSFGFTQAETDDLLDRAGLPQKAHELKEMYNGYQIGKYTLYNPFSMVLFISEVLDDPEGNMKEALKPYWINTGGTHLIGYLIENNLTKLQEGIMSLLDNKPIQTSIDENIIFDPQLTYNTISFWSVLLLSGYVKSLASEEDEYGDEIHTLSFPNEEIRRSMRQLLLRVTFGREDSRKVPQAMKALAQGDVASFVSFVQDYLMTTISYFDVHPQAKEKSYQLLMLGMMAYFANTHHVRSNRESGKGRYDISLEPKNKARKGIIMELKVADEGEDLTQVAQKAFDQLQSKQYKTDMEARGVQDFVLLGMAFRGKELQAITD